MQGPLPVRLLPAARFAVAIFPLQDLHARAATGSLPRLTCSVNLHADPLIIITIIPSGVQLAARHYSLLPLDVSEKPSETGEAGEARLSLPPLQLLDCYLGQAQSILR